MKKYKNKKLYILSFVLLFFAPISFVMLVIGKLIKSDMLFQFNYDVVSLQFVDKYGKIG